MRRSVLHQGVGTLFSSLRATSASFARPPRAKDADCKACTLVPAHPTNQVPHLVSPHLQVEDRPVVKERVEQVGGESTGLRCWSVTGCPAGWLAGWEAGGNMMQDAGGPCTRLWLALWTFIAPPCACRPQVMEHRPVEKEFVVSLQGPTLRLAFRRLHSSVLCTQPKAGGCKALPSNCSLCPWPPFRWRRARRALSVPWAAERWSTWAPRCAESQK